MIIVWQNIPDSVQIYDVDDELVDWSKVHDRYINMDDDTEEVEKLMELLQEYEPVDMGPEGLSIEGKIIVTGQLM